MQITPVDLKDPELYRDGIPHQIFTQLRREAPISWKPEANGRGFWAVTRYDDIVAVSKAPKVFSSARERGGHRMFDEHVVGVAGLGANEAEAPMISMDPPRHNHYRRMLSPGFSPTRIRQLEERIRDRVRAILDRLEGAKPATSSQILQPSCRSRCWPNCSACHRRIEASSSNGPMH
jgi:linalool 8-monooxygenase